MLESWTADCLFGGAEELDEVDGLIDAEERYLGKVLAELDP